MKRACVILKHLHPDTTLDDLAQHPCAATAPGGKLSTAEDAAALLKDGDVVTVCLSEGASSADLPHPRRRQVAGFAGTSCPDLLLQAVRARYDATQQPRNLTLIFVASPGDGKERGLNRLATRGLVSKAIYSWTGVAPRLGQLVHEGAVQAWNLPLGVGAHAASLVNA